MLHIVSCKRVVYATNFGQLPIGVFLEKNIPIEDTVLNINDHNLILIFISADRSFRLRSTKLSATIMWRETVYSGTLRPVSKRQLTGGHLNLLLDKLSITIGSNASTRLSNVHSVNRIINGLYLGDKDTAKDTQFLVLHGFTHVINVADGLDEYQVDTGESYYKGLNIKYLGIPGHDRPSWNISVYFEKAAKFIEHAISNGGNVLVHCVVGISRSATIVIAYLMISERMTAAEALQFVFSKRKVFPNIGFLHHLAQLDSILGSKGTLFKTTKYY